MVESTEVWPDPDSAIGPVFAALAKGKALNRDNVGEFAPDLDPARLAIAVSTLIDGGYDISKATGEDRKVTYFLNDKTQRLYGTPTSRGVGRAAKARTTASKRITARTQARKTTAPTTPTASPSLKPHEIARERRLARLNAGLPSIPVLLTQELEAGRTVRVGEFALANNCAVSTVTAALGRLQAKGMNLEHHKDGRGAVWRLAKAGSPRRAERSPQTTNGATAPATNGRRPGRPKASPAAQRAGLDHAPRIGDSLTVFLQHWDEDAGTFSIGLSNGEMRWTAQITGATRRERAGSEHA